MEKNQQELRSHRCCFTGHRPQYLKRTLEEIQVDLEKAIREAVSEGYTTFITGMSQGADIIAGETVCRLKADDPRLKLIAAVPFPGFEDRWGSHWKNRFKALLEKADFVKYVASGFSPDVFDIRNRWMVDKSAKVIAVFSGKHGGTLNTIRYARERKVPVECLAE